MTINPLAKKLLVKPGHRVGLVNRMMRYWGDCLDRLKEVVEE